MDKNLIQQIAVPESRIASGSWEGERHTGEGDIHASYSADVIAMESRIRAPFRHGSHLWACVGIRSGGDVRSQFEAYRLLPESMFPGTVSSYNAKVRIEGGDAARNDANGFYHGMAVKHGGSRYVLTGPPSIFVSEPNTAPAPPLQMEMF